MTDAPKRPRYPALPNPYLESPQPLNPALRNLQYVITIIQSIVPNPTAAAPVQLAQSEAARRLTDAFKRNVDDAALLEILTSAPEVSQP